MLLPAAYEVLDLTDADRYPPKPSSLFTIGRYNEKRPGVYSHAIFGGTRNHHIGIDLGAPAGTPIFAFSPGKIFAIADHLEPGNYGPTLITEHKLGGKLVFALYGHLSRSSLQDKKVGQTIEAGELIAFLGTESENGGWPPHLHFQLSYRAPTGGDMPGVVSEEELPEALALYPDPRLVLGPIY